MHRIGGFQSSALPTELPGRGVRKRVLNSRARSESSPERRFRGSEPIIPGSGRADPEKCDVRVLENDPEGDAGGFGMGGGKRPISDSQSVEIGLG